LLSRGLPSDRVNEWIEIYATDDAFRAHLANDAGKGPPAAVVEACDTITCRCWGDPDAVSREMLAGFGTTYHVTAPAAFVLRPRADNDSPG
jgi:hypothetical protein